MNDTTVYLKSGDSMQVDSVTTSMITLITDDTSIASQLILMAQNHEFDEYEADTDEGHIKAPKDNKFLGISATVYEDDGYYYVLSFVPKTEAEIMQEQIDALTEENERLKGDSEYAEAGKILFGEEVEE